LTCLCDQISVYRRKTYNNGRDLLPCGYAVVGLHVETIVFTGGVV
jgi:hypothetical protein